MASDIVDYSSVWGDFDTGSGYGGGYVRGMPTVSGNGVVNAVREAVEFTVFEEVAKRDRMIC